MNSGTVYFYTTVAIFICLAVISVMAADADARCQLAYSADTCFYALNR